MKYLLMILAVVMIFAGQALAADGNLSHDALAQMGLSSINVMSDAQGTAIRGMGYRYCPPKTSVNVSGNAQVSLGKHSPVSNAGYDASGTCLAAGAGFAKTTSTTSVLIDGCLVPVCSTTVCATVGSIAFAK